ncbi:MAG: peptidoglycan DD-metalloendopeptidase family protein, partial [Rickettsiales bacterium]|nr:peptidoglycan DD-metalloendopeptidase family protein [Rickettsiales bacterium]
DIAQLKKLQGDASLRDASTRAEKATLRNEQQALARELNSREKLQTKLSVDHERAQEQVAKLSRESASLQELLGKLEANEKAQQKLSTATKASAKLRHFDGKKGSARAPVSGGILHRFGEPNASNGSYRGMVFQARAGAAVVAPYDGEIVFTGPFRDYGNMVLIKHSNGYISLIAGLGRVSAGLNQPTLRGEPIGTMPETGSAEAYVELRDTSAKPIDPADWFANVVAKSAP